MKRTISAKMHELGHTIKRVNNPLYGKVRDAEKYEKWWTKGKTLVCWVGDEFGTICQKIGEEETRELYNH